jgi:hypothetical protein
MRKPSPLPLLYGATAFIAAHAVEAALRIGGEHPWFLSELPSLLFTAGTMALTGLVVGSVTRGAFVDIFLHAIFLVIGAGAAMTVTLFLQPDGPGNLFPIVLIVGTCVLGVSGVAGAALGWLLARSVRL